MTLVEGKKGVCVSNVLDVILSGVRQNICDVAIWSVGKIFFLCSFFTQFLKINIKAENISFSFPEIYNHHKIEWGMSVLNWLRSSYALELFITLSK